MMVPAPVFRGLFPVRDYDLDATLDSGQAFRWVRSGGGWSGVLGRRAVRLWHRGDALEAEVWEEPGDWRWLREYLRVDEDLDDVLAAFPDDPPLREAVGACRGLRLLRQDPWECLASFILSSTKQIVQIRQVIALLCERYGDLVPGWAAGGVRAFPHADRLAGLSEAELRACRMGFRARYLGEAARRVAGGELDLGGLHALPLEVARAALEELPGVGRKIADCVLLFAYGHASVFPVDVWVQRALEELYFPRRRLAPARLRAFAETYFGPRGGYAQQYLFHYMRGRAGRVALGGVTVAE